MKVTEIAFVGYPVTDLKRARRFYEGTLGLTVSRSFGLENHGFVEYDIGAGTLAIANSMPKNWVDFKAKWKPGIAGGLVTLEVEDFDEAISRLKADGVTFAHEPAETPVCTMAVALDPDGNAIVIHKRKPE
jgi:catechol 2,3-dioxygenase-like lactoylglutathione lyase family enzyme